MRHLSPVVVLLALAPVALFGAPQERALPFDDPAWELTGPSVRRASGERGAELVVETGVATRRDVSLLNGTIDFDVMLSDRRSFVYVWMRMQSEGEHEEFYLRPHKSNLPDAIQYAPVYQGHSAWQLFHGPGGTAATPFTPGQWTPVRVVLDGSRAALFIGDLTTPAIVVPRLARDPKPGYIAVRGFVPAGTPGSAPAARFANVRVRPDYVPFTFPAPPPSAPAAEGTIIGEWSVSRAVVPTTLTPDTLPTDAQVGPFTTVAASASGLVELHKWVTLPEGSRAAAAVARVTLRADRAITVPLDLGFSDVATVFLSGVPIARRDDRYSFDEPRREGLVGLDQLRVYLPLRAGDNVLSVVVEDSFGGWAVAGRVGNAAGVTILQK
jgi:hypothetical protein